MPFAPSAWYVAQWQQDSYVQPTLLPEANSNSLHEDPKLGKPTYVFAAPDGHAAVRVYNQNGSWVYELEESGGTLTGKGGSNLFLSVNAVEPGARFDQDISYDTDIKLSAAMVHYDMAGAAISGAVLSQVFTGFGLMFSDPITREQQFVFMQLPIAVSRPTPPTWFSICSLVDKKPKLLYVPARDQDHPLLAYKADNGDMHHLHYLLNTYVSMLVSSPYRCADQWIEWPSSARDLRNWRLTSLYIGLETETSDHRPGSLNLKPQGEIETAVEIANARVTHGNF